MVRSQPHLLKTRPVSIPGATSTSRLNETEERLLAPDGPGRPKRLPVALRSSLPARPLQTLRGSAHARSLVGRVEPLAKIRESVTSKDWCGSVVVGKGGIGKTAP